MFSYVAQFISYMAGGGDDTLLENELKEPEIPTQSDNKDFELKRSFNGKITSYFNNRGLINDHIYFTQNVVTGNEQPQVGDTVVAEAARLHIEGGWVANKVQITTFWNIDNNDDNNEPFKDIIIGVITDQKPHSLSVKTSTDLTISVTKLRTGYRPFRGDWVQIEVWRKNSQSAENNESNITEDDIVSVSPLREKKVNGIVTDLFSGFGFINDDIYFSFSVCKRGERVRKGDQVFALLIESKQKRGDWRALEVSRKNNNKNNIESEDKTDRKIVSKPTDIEIKDNMDFGDVMVNTSRRLEISVSNNGSEALEFQCAEMEKHVPGFSFCYGPSKNNIKDKTSSFSSVLWPSMMINPTEKKIILATFKPQSLGKLDIHVSLSFTGTKIHRKITANVIDELHTNLTPNISYKKPTFFGKTVNTRFADNAVVPGQRPVRKKKIFLPNKLDKYPVPTYLKDHISYAKDDIELLVPELTKPLHISTYKRKLSSLLYIEELQMEEEMREYDLTEVVLRPVGEFLSLNVPGLAEGRPSLLLGDRVIVKYHGIQKSPSYEGYIHEVHADDVLLKFNEEFHNKYCNDDINVQFYFNRTPLRRAHQAVDNAINLGEEVLFPKPFVPKSSLFHLKNGRIKPFNKVLNERQLLAVSRILEGRGRPIPYVLFGPPGTGKSITVVESILQVFKSIKYSRILACAPSNSAADLIAERLHESGMVRTCDMVRMNAFHRLRMPVPETVLQYSVSEVDDLRLACRYRIIISTCSMAGFLYSFDLKVGHFTHIFVDEAGQATEPECLIPVGFAAGCDEAHIVLAGDPFQLGPVLRSDISSEYGLGLSFLERLMTREVYQRNEELFTECYNPLIVTKLVNNYRSNEDLLKLSSAMFYNRELVPCADAQLAKKFLSLDFLPNPNIPFIFHGLRSEDYREGNSPSWFNPMEAVQVLKYVQLILRTSLQSIDVDDIGVITPYRKQVEKIRLLLERFNLSDIKVGSVEEFQGQERQCIIISTVRSNEELVNFDCLHNVGFLSNPKRFNVSITRAQALLVIVGNPVVLCYDPYWCAMLQYAVMTGCYTGCDLPSLDHEIIRENFKKAVQLVKMPEEEDTKTGNGSLSSDNPVSSNITEPAVGVQLNNSSNTNSVDASKILTDQAISKASTQPNCLNVLHSDLRSSTPPFSLANTSTSNSTLHNGSNDVNSRQQTACPLSSSNSVRPQFEILRTSADATQNMKQPYQEVVAGCTMVKDEALHKLNTYENVGCSEDLTNPVTLTESLKKHESHSCTGIITSTGGLRQSGTEIDVNTSRCTEDDGLTCHVNDGILQQTHKTLNNEEVDSTFSTKDNMSVSNMNNALFYAENLEDELSLHSKETSQSPRRRTNALLSSLQKKNKTLEE